MAYLTKAAKAGHPYAVELVYHPPENLKLRLFLRRIERVPTAMTKAASFPENELGAVTWVSYVEDQPCRCAEYAVGAMALGIFKQQLRPCQVCWFRCNRWSSLTRATLYSLAV
jgi:hypothetical protein